MDRRAFIGRVTGGVLAVPLATRAQTASMPVIGFLHSGSPGPTAPFVAAFRQGLNETGYVEGQNLAIEYRWAEFRDDRLPATAADLVSRKVDVILTGGFPAARAAKAAASTITIIFNYGGDPVGDGLVSSLARPGGNVTGFTNVTADLTSKRFALVRVGSPGQGDRPAGEPEQFGCQADDVKRAGSGAGEGGAALYH